MQSIVNDFTCVGDNSMITIFLINFRVKDIPVYGYTPPEGYTPNFWKIGGIPKIGVYPRFGRVYLRFFENMGLFLGGIPQIFRK